MKHPTRHISRRMRKVDRGAQALAREILTTVKKMREDATFRKLLNELAKHLVEFAVRIIVISAMNQCVQPGREQAQVVPFRPRAIS